MSFILKNLGITDYSNHNELYSKLVRNQLPFNIELHNLQQNTNFQIRILRDHPSVERVIKAYTKVDMITKQANEFSVEKSVIRLAINDKTFMLDTGSKCKISIVEYNITKSFSDFPKGKVAVIIDFFFDNEVDTAKIRSELKDTFIKTEGKEAI